jgi:hypothetical protein
MVHKAFQIQNAPRGRAAGGANHANRTTIFGSRSAICKLCPEEFQTQLEDPTPTVARYFMLRNALNSTLTKSTPAAVQFKLSA